MILSLDTNVLIDLLNDHPRVRAGYDEASARDDELVVSPMAAQELVYGALVSRRPDWHLARAEALLGDLRPVDFTQEDGLAAAAIKASLKRQGTPIGAYDLLIAGQALNRGWTVVSANLHEYERVDGLSTTSWTAR